ncbi:MAG: AAA family ATPase, partial [Ignavibacteriaceae bacterium]|nr:AAA family ATPase [Ignavibacteriaceae bacterium]
MTKKKIPYGVSNFEKIVNENFYFVDKTKYLEVIENLNEQNLFFLRPRKFGKSLFISLLEYYYGIEHKDKFDTLFGEYYIGKNPTPKANSYYILRFDFSGILTSTNENTLREFSAKVIDGLVYFSDAYQLFDKSELDEILSQQSSNQMLLTFFRNFNS